MIRLLAGFLLAILSAAVEAGGVTIDACTYVGENGAILRFRLQNNAGHKVTVPRERAPWAADGAVVLAYKGSAINGSILRRAHPVQDSFSSDIEIEPGEESGGDIFLSLIFPDIDKSSERDLVTVFWSYPSHGLDFNVTPAGGVLTLGGEGECDGRVGSIGAR